MKAKIKRIQEEKRLEEFKEKQKLRDFNEKSKLEKKLQWEAEIKRLLQD